jgi:hypothetical protein
MKTSQTEGQRVYFTVESAQRPKIRRLRVGENTAVNLNRCCHTNFQEPQGKQFGCILLLAAPAATVHFKPQELPNFSLFFTI